MPAESREVTDNLVASVAGVQAEFAITTGALVAGGSHHPVAAVEHGAEQLTPRPPSAQFASNGHHCGTATARQAS